MIDGVIAWLRGGDPVDRVFRSMGACFERPPASSLIVAVAGKLNGLGDTTAQRVAEIELIDAGPRNRPASKWSRRRVPAAVTWSVTDIVGCIPVWRQLR